MEEHTKIEKKEGDEIHAEAKEERVPASNSRQCGSRFHGFYFSFF